MSDFLGNLAMKSLGLAPLVQPRPLSQFEALPAEGQAAPVDLLADAVSDTRAERPERPMLRMGVEGRSTPFDTPPAVSVPRAQVERPAPVQPLAVSLTQVASQAETLGPALRRTPAPNPPAELTPASLGHPQPLAMPAPELFERSPWTSPRPAPAPPLAGSPSAPAPLAETLAGESHAASPARRIVLTPVIEQIRPSPPAAPAESRTQPAERAESVPAISVTIGRVEVRAALSPETSARRAAAGAKPAASISLNDYLRLRSGGKP